MNKNKIISLAAVTAILLTSSMTVSAESNESCGEPLSSTNKGTVTYYWTDREWELI